MKLPRLPDLTGGDQRQVNGMVRRLHRAETRSELAAAFITEIDCCLPGDMAGWGEMSPDYEQFTGMEISPAYLATTARLVEPISQLLPHHPALEAVGWSGSRVQPRRISDFQSLPRFRDNPLHREAYRHLDANHQVAFSPGVGGDSAVVISLNRKHTDYSARDCQKLHLLGLLIGELLGGPRKGSGFGVWGRSWWSGAKFERLSVSAWIRDLRAARQGSRRDSEEARNRIGS
ncbi:hypothetical protein [Synoicihabitans lomoniglobus]|uniref:Uncharacterized protein n=1 Tax=Synoicihabitans lomoniglobus TaxID=2909285 RepID=A0AAE9ZWT7_9BACT|nr:hypothetical protein [Opitutaceae bacterium LMO-M01]WED64330.1 hypothetical protein PXH66_18485 [Opitutaceae bacterium LMO-M01]